MIGEELQPHEALAELWGLKMVFPLIPVAAAAAVVLGVGALFGIRD
jgi:hypothetical protein